MGTDPAGTGIDARCCAREHRPATFDVCSTARTPALRRGRKDTRRGGPCLPQGRVGPSVARGLLAVSVRRGSWPRSRAARPFWQPAERARASTRVPSGQRSLPMAGQRRRERRVILCALCRRLLCSHARGRPGRTAMVRNGLPVRVRQRASEPAPRFLRFRSAPMTTSRHNGRGRRRRQARRFCSCVTPPAGSRP